MRRKSPPTRHGSWVAIRGANLANTNPGRTWRSDEIVNGALPVVLDGVSVTIDGKPAFVEYIGPTQINVQAPSDSTVGVVNVVVTNNGVASPPMPAALQTAAPAWFLYSGTNYAIASRLPDYARVGPSTIAGTIVAQPGDIIALWGTGFGSTNPAAPAGAVVSGAPAAATAPVVTLGGMPVPVLNTVLAVGSVGLYQVTVQIPANMPTGSVAVEASVNGVKSSSGVLLQVGIR